ncbi:C4-dicarboxylate transporter DctQ subunit [Litoreibacter meonggei]|uniref:TRAP transporter small permease protein n=1 Tax=Litoreibacter meonggei TaxID=1049199 RepID=A0A497WUL6_9RHOB|nr:TRAP transporter small permease [Litoreibacter meonggei]RLJ59527.1 C4-dicarboxylate transporter DctQ subunit [Litoreibacter meonggei]
MAHAARSFLDSIEETFIAVLLGLMTLLTFANVIARYVFNANILWALELTVFMFAWLVLLGASYAVKKGAHLGVDAILNIVSPGVKKVLGIIAGLACVAFAFLLLKGAWDYWANFANLPATEGRWFPTGFEDKFRGKGWYETNDIPVPGVLKFLEDMFNDGDEYEKLPRLIPYLVLPVSMALFFLRSVQAFFALVTGKIDMLIVSHEAEDDVEEAAARLAADLKDT